MREKPIRRGPRRKGDPDAACDTTDAKAQAHSLADDALSHAARTLIDILGGSLYGPDIASELFEPSSPPAAWIDEDAGALMVKSAARKLGADLVGICRVERRWLASADALGSEYERAVVMAVAMDSESIAASPAPAASAATSVGYMRMAMIAGAVSVFIRRMGFHAVAAGNQLAPSIPMAIEAGLGELGRNDQLITRRFGPCVRLCKVFTDMPLRCDETVALGVEDFCRECGLCVEACPAGAVEAVEESHDPADTRPFRRADGKLCRKFWRRNGNSCATCIGVCPYTHGQAPGQ